MSAQPGGEIILYQRGDGPAIDVRLSGDTAWLSLNQIAALLGRDKSTISRHIANVFSESELSRNSVVAEFATTAADGKTYQVEYFNLDVIISVGYRVKSQQGTQFRIWATQRLREYLVKGFTMDDARLKNLGGGNYWKELLDRIRDIRSSEKVLYRQVLDLYATSVDYDPKAEASTAFFKTVQNKLHYAAHGQTAAEVVRQRADAGKPFMGLLSFSGSKPTRGEAIIAKNYLDADELKRLNALVSAYFDAAEFRAMNHEPTHMKDWLSHLERMIAAMGGKALQGAGKVSHQDALAHAESEFARFRSQQDALPSDVEAVYLETVKAAQKKISGKKQP
ncbi:RhuM family protein [Dokdonella sp.]|uniref:virulence RhuM family protein n=1 Tax=Dokdonella sp. TaxID=2291710 RepID=UPI002CB01F9C|nr:RhuM family protein [Dokdonella sp.]HOX72297.1 RhuM family protein [Dokdonella sp.]HPN80321.1 RhuM family protein [Dokdonella sp.]